MDWTILKTEIVGDPLALGYLGMTSAQVAASLNGLTRARLRDVISAYEIVDTIVPAEWAAISTAEQRRIEFIVSAGAVNMRNANVRAAFIAAFGPATATRAALAALQSELVSRCNELKLPSLHTGDVDYARSL